MVSAFWVAHGEVLLIDLFDWFASEKISSKIGGVWLSVEGGWLEEVWSCSGAVCRSSMAVSEVKIAKNRDQNREEDENSRPGKIRSEIRSTGLVTGQPGVESGQPGGKPGSSQKFVRLCSGAMHPVGDRSTGPVIGQAGLEAGPTGPWAGTASVPAVFP